MQRHDSRNHVISRNRCSHSSFPTIIWESSIRLTVGSVSSHQKHEPYLIITTNASRSFWCVVAKIKRNRDSNKKTTFAQYWDQTRADGILSQTTAVTVVEAVRSKLVRVQ